MKRYLFLLACACGGLNGGDDGGFDAGNTPDGPFCEVGVTFSPTSPSAGDTVYATGYAPTGGFLTYTWTVKDPSNADVPYDSVATDDSRIRFTPTTGGPYYVSLDVDGCAGYYAPLNVRAAGATDTLWRVRLIAPPGAGVPPQERTFDVPSGANYDTGELALDTGSTISGHVVDASNTPVPAYLRLVATGAPDLIVDGFAGTDGAFSITTTLDRHDVLVIPFRSDLPAFTELNWTPQSGDLVADAGVAISGTVHDPSGAALAGATVAITVDGVPSSVAVTDASGNYTVHVHSGTLATVEVVPPSTRGLPRLTSAAFVIDLQGAVNVAYAATLASSNVGGTTVEQGGTIAPGASVTFTGAIANAGTVDGTVAASGTFAIRATADGSGVLPATQVPSVPTSAVVIPPGAAGGVVAVDLGGATPATIDAPPAVSADGHAIDSTAAAIPGADVRATPTGALADANAAELHVVAGADGTFALPLAGGGTYQLTIVDPRGDAALLRNTVTAGPLGDLVLPNGLHLKGSASINGSNLAGVAVTVYCEQCTGDARRMPAAEAATDATGRFSTTLLDPGVQ